MWKIEHAFEVLIVISCIYKSLAAYTGVSYDPSFDVTNISPDFKATTLFELKHSMGVTYDSTSGKFYAITGFNSGNQMLYEICGNSNIPIATISPEDVVLTCLTSGPSGLYALDIINLNFGKIDTKTGAWKLMNSLPPPFDLYVFAQDSEGLLHYINGAGDYYTSRGPDKKMKQVDGITFPTEFTGFCGDFKADSDNTIVTANFSPSGGLVMYDIDDGSTKQKNISPSNVFMLDVTNGPLSEVCPASKLTGLSIDPTESINDINPMSFSSSSKKALAESPGITQDKASGTLYALKGFKKGDQNLIAVCSKKSIDVAPISPSSVALTCLTSGPSGVYAIDLESKSFGAINVKSGKFTRVGDLASPYDMYAFAQDVDGNLHYINGDGIHFKSKAKGSPKMQETGVVFPTDVADGFCGDFDGSDILAANFGIKGGIVRYSLLTSSVTLEKNSRSIFYADVTTGPYPTECPAERLTAISSSSNRVATINPMTGAVSLDYKLENNKGITSNSKGEIYAITGNKAGEQELVQVCSSRKETIATISQNVLLKCMTHGPKGTYVIETITNNYGKINLETGRYTRVGTLKGSTDTFVFAQDSEGILHFINGDGKYYTNRKDADIFRVEAGSRFPTDVKAICGEFDGDDIVAVATESNKGGTIRYSFSTLSATTQISSPTTLFNDVTTASLSEADNSACSSSKSSKGKKSSKSKSKSAKVMSRTSSDLRYRINDTGRRK